MNQKSSLSQPTQSASRVLTADRRRPNCTHSRAQTLGLRRGILGYKNATPSDRPQKGIVLVSSDNVGARR